MYLSKVFKVVLLLSLMALIIPLSIARGQVTVGYSYDRGILYGRLRHADN